MFHHQDLKLFHNQDLKCSTIKVEKHSKIPHTFMTNLIKVIPTTNHGSSEKHR